MHIKENILLTELTKSVPKEIYDFFMGIRNVHSKEAIDYNKLKLIFYGLLEKEGV